MVKKYFENSNYLKLNSNIRTLYLDPGQFKYEVALWERILEMSD